ncbi:hypothetical protein THTE_0737 [Thermogutta terrifontis]|uniref:Uncharacterized protein n=1 Tax=Thermogutta terrifontis TaxID=1331910 RepID=A0A286RBK9_9BACT|nr:hypothetical protein THTE_0737 [Thermogutta terrifontis]
MNRCTPRSAGLWPAFHAGFQSPGKHQLMIERCTADVTSTSLREKRT